MINVLVTGTGGGVGQGIIKSLKLISDLDIKIIATDMNAKATGLYSGDVACLVSACDSDNYINSLEKIFKRESIDYYFPGTDLELEFCAINKSMIKKKYGVCTVISSIEAVRISDNKYKTSKFLKENDLPYPETNWAKDVDVSQIRFPIIVKPAVGCRSIGVFQVSNTQELLNVMPDKSGIVIQELVGDHDSEYTCTIVKVGDIVSEVLVLKRTLRSGDTFRAEPVKNKIIEDYVRDVAIKLDIEGGCNFQLRLDSNGIPKIFEINCRFSGTTPFCSQLGFNPVEYYLKKILCIPYEFNIDYESSVLRFWSEIVVKKEMISKLNSEGRCEPFLLKQFNLF